MRKKKFQFLNNVDMSLIYQLYCSEDYHQNKNKRSYAQSDVVEFN